MRKYAAEALGTFALVFVGAGSVVTNDISHGALTLVGISTIFGLLVMALIYALGDISGAHINPSVTFGFWLAGRLPGRCVAPYIISQVLGALAASSLLRLLFGNRVYLGATLPAGPEMQSFFLEIILTAFLMFVILSVSSGPKEVGIMAGIAIGGVIGLEVIFAGPISGASMNPARSLAPALISGHLTSLWIYLTAPLIGAAVALPCFRLTRKSAVVSAGG